MILKSIATAIKRQDWFVVILEILVVVFGVFIGLQVDDWNKMRQDQALEQEYLLRLYADIKGSIEDQLETDSWDERRISSQDLVLKALKRGELLEEEVEEFTWGLISFAIMNPVRMRWGTVEELKSTGNLSIIRDLELRQMLGLFEGSVARRQDLMKKSNDYILLSRSYFQGQVAIERENSSTPTRPTAVFDFEAMAADQELFNRLSQAQDNSVFIRSAQKRHLGELVELRKKLGQILGLEEQAD